MTGWLDSGKYDLKGRNFNYDVTRKEIIFYPQQVSPFLRLSLLLCDPH